MAPIILSHFQTTPLLQARAASQRRALVSPDLGLTTVEVTVEPEDARFPAGEPHKVQVLSELMNRLYSLMLTPAAPAPGIRRGGAQVTTRIQLMTTNQPDIDFQVGIGYNRIAHVNGTTRKPERRKPHDRLVHPQRHLIIAPAAG